MRHRLPRLAPGLVLWLLGLAALMPAAASTLSWRPLSIDGHRVQWERPEGSTGKLVLTWRIVEAEHAFADALNCRRLASPREMLAASRVPEAAFRAELAAALEMWQQAADVVFVEAAAGAEANILIGAQAEPEGRAFTDVAFDRAGSGARRAITRSLVCLNPAVRWKVGFDGNLDIYDLRYTLAHEIGHAIGLDHPEAPGTLMWFRYSERSHALQPGDIAGAAALYGRSATGTIVTRTAPSRSPEVDAVSSAIRP